MFQTQEQATIGPCFSDDKEIFHSEVAQVIASVREELDDHRQAINENTSEMESNFSFVLEVAKRVDALSERLDALSVQVSQGLKSVSFAIEPLNLKEKRVFSTLYALTEEDPETTYLAISRRLGFSEELVAGYITNLIEKGVPLKKRYVSKQARLSINPAFRDQQAKTNLVRLDAPLTAWM